MALVNHIPEVTMAPGQVIPSKAIWLLSPSNSSVVDNVPGILDIAWMLPGMQSSLCQLLTPLGGPKLRFYYLGVILLGQQGFDLLLCLALTF